MKIFAREAEMCWVRTECTDGIWETVVCTSGASEQATHIL